MTTSDKQDTGRPPAPHDPSTDRVGWIAMGVVAALGFAVLVWAATLNAG